MSHYCSICGRTHYDESACPRRNDPSRAGQLGFDILKGDLTIGLGGGLVEDLSTGDLELQIAPGIDIDLTNGDLF